MSTNLIEVQTKSQIWQFSSHEDLLNFALTASNAYFNLFKHSYNLFFGHKLEVPKSPTRWFPKGFNEDGLNDFVPYISSEKKLQEKFIQYNQLVEQYIVLNQKCWVAIAEFFKASPVTWDDFYKLTQRIRRYQKQGQLKWLDEPVFKDIALKFEQLLNQIRPLHNEVCTLFYEVYKLSPPIDLGNQKAKDLIDKAEEAISTKKL